MISFKLYQKYLCTIIVAFIIFSRCKSHIKLYLLQENNINFPYSINGKWGVIDTFGKIVVAPKYDEISLFNYELAKIKYHNKYGYINQKGKLVIKPKFTTGGNFYYDCTLVTLDTQAYYINRIGRKKKFANCEISGLRMGCISGHDPQNISKFLIKKDNVTAIIFENLRDTTRLYFDTVYRYNDYFYVVSKDKKFGFFNKLSPYNYDKDEYYFDSINKYNYDEVIVQFNKWLYDESKEYYSSDYAIVKKNERWGLIYAGSGKIIELVKPIYLNLEFDVYTSSIKVEYMPNSYGYVDRTGKELFSR